MTALASAAMAAMFVLPLLFLGVVCAYGPLRDAVCDRRLARRRQVERVVSAYRPIRLAEWTGQGWREVVPGGAR